MAQVNLSILKITGDNNDYLITDEMSRDIATEAQSTAQAAQSTATEAQSTAQSAQSTAQSAQSTAQAAQSTAQAAQSTADSKLKTITLKSNYTQESKTLTISLNTSTN